MYTPYTFPTPPAHPLKPHPLTHQMMVESDLSVGWASGYSHAVDYCHVLSLLLTVEHSSAQPPGGGGLQSGMWVGQVSHCLLAHQRPRGGPIGFWGWGGSVYFCVGGREWGDRECGDRMYRGAHDGKEIGWETWCVGRIAQCGTHTQHAHTTYTHHENHMHIHHEKHIHTQPHTQSTTQYSSSQQPSTTAKHHPPQMSVVAKTQWSSFVAALNAHAPRVLAPGAPAVPAAV